MKNIVTLFVLIMIIVYSAKVILRLYGALSNAMPIYEPDPAMNSQEEQK